MESLPANTIRFSLLSLLGITGCICGILAVVSYTQSVVLGIHLSLALLGWVLWRYAHGHAAGVLLTILGGDILASSSVGWVFRGTDDLWGVRFLAHAVASLLIVAGLVAFVWICAKGRTGWRLQAGIAITIFCALVGWWIAIPFVGDAAIAQRAISDTALNKTAMEKAILLVEDVKRELGTTPDEDSLRIKLSEPLPSVRWDGHVSEIEYRKTGESTYELIFVFPSFFGDFYVYDSVNPSSGWQRVPF